MFPSQSNASWLGHVAVTQNTFLCSWSWFSRTNCDYFALFGGADPLFLPLTMDRTSWWIKLDVPTDYSFWIIHSFIIHWLFGNLTRCYREEICGRGCWETAKFDVTDKNRKATYYATSRNFSILQCPWVTYGSSPRIFLFWSDRNCFLPCIYSLRIGKKQVLQCWLFKLLNFFSICENTGFSDTFFFSCSPNFHVM